MAHPERENVSLDLPAELHKRKRIILGELKERTLWFKLRIGFLPALRLAHFWPVDRRDFSSPSALLPLHLIQHRLLFFSRPFKRGEPERDDSAFHLLQVGFAMGPCFSSLFPGTTESFHLLFIFPSPFPPSFCPPFYLQFAAIAAMGMGLLAMAEFCNGSPTSLSQGAIDLSIALPYGGDPQFLRGSSLCYFSISAVRGCSTDPRSCRFTETVTDLNDH
jgi:hypothetical protein